MGYSDLVAAADAAARAHLGGATVTYAPLVGAPVVVEGMFDDAYVLVEGTEAGVESVGPSVFLDAANIALLPTHPDADEPTLTINAIDYKVAERQSEGMGGIRLILHRASI